MTGKCEDMCKCGHTRRFHKNEFVIVKNKRKEMDTSCNVLGCACFSFAKKENFMGD